MLNNFIKKQSRSMNIIEILNNELIKIFDKLELDKKYAFFQYSDRPDLSDFQTNCAMPLCKILKKSPRDIANLIVPELEKTNLFEKISIDGPGFINITLKDEELLKIVNSYFKDDKLGYNKEDKKTVSCQQLTVFLKIIKILINHHNTGTHL